ncbi:aldehyde dehydrogenase family protein [Sporichthya sp.]|uniref:aldehyde dehydrogenase family protein n=1 Tax=Sporichthya sp. TaxID=65475 RepID=UPI0017CAD20C|nr:aldehyde dehydrogenase family protein [Sporichthya sp.]MBA3741387.1 aldehyde dehydrogenase family protein [Sporichthya sp.]
MIVSTSPQRPDDVVVEIAETTAAAVGERARAARAAQREWAALSPLARAGILCELAEDVRLCTDELAALVTREIGKTALEARGEVGRTVQVLQFHAQQALAAGGETYPAVGPPGTILFTQRRPLGLAGLITTWNFPLAIPAWKLAPALAAGNAVLLKPAPEATAIALRLGELLAVRLPDGLLQVLPGGVPTAEAVLVHADCVSFTGSVSGGRAVVAAATARNIPVQSEMGGHNASVVLPDADPARAAQVIAEAAMEFAGQKCTATRRVVVVGDPHAFTEALVAAVDGLRQGDPDEPGTVVGPVISERARSRVLEAAALARTLGGRVIAGGRTGDGPGWALAPTLVDGLTPDCVLAQEEVFGPFAMVLPARDVADALEIVNGTPFGLAAAIFTGDLDAALAFADRVLAGQVKVNAKTSGADPHVPFGGERNSGSGPKEQGSVAAEFYTVGRTVTICPAI